MDEEQSPNISEFKSNLDSNRKGDSWRKKEFEEENEKKRKSEMEG